MTGSSRRLLLLLSIGIALAAMGWFLLGEGAGFRGGVTSDEGGSAADPLQEGPETPVLVGRGTEAAEQGAEPSDEPPPRDDDWVIEIASVKHADGRPVAEADVVIELPLPPTLSETMSGAFISYETEALDWVGAPVSLRVRRYEEGRKVDPRREDMPLFDPQGKVVVWVMAEGHAHWFSTPLTCPPERHTKIHAVLQPRRALGGRVHAQSGRTGLQDVDFVLLTVPGVSQDIYSSEADVGEDGAFTFDPDEIPSGPVLVTAFSASPGLDGWRTTERVGPKQESVTLMLGSSYEFIVDCRILEAPAWKGRIGGRQVRIQALETTEAEESDVVYYVSEEFRESYQIVLPAGPSERWQALSSGYEPVDFALAPSGPKRVIPIRIDLKPAAQSALLEIEVDVPKGLGGSGMQGRLESAQGLRVPLGQWFVPDYEDGGTLRAVYRVPSGVPLGLQLSVWSARRKARCVVPPIDAQLHAGQHKRVRVKALMGGTLRVVRKMKGGLLPELRIIARSESGWMLLPLWRPGRSTAGRPSYYALRALAPGRWTLALVRDGLSLPWSATVDIQAGKASEVEVPFSAIPK